MILPKEVSGMKQQRHKVSRLHKDFGVLLMDRAIISVMLKSYNPNVPLNTPFGSQR